MNIFDGRYEQEELLGQGAFSEVWKVKDIQTGVTLALKIYTPAIGSGTDGDEMLTHEFALMVNANHRNLIRPLFYAVCDHRPYLILPFCQQGNIGKLVGKMTEDQAWHLLHDTASALAYLHGMNPPILHQDIKPANILLADDGSYMLTDFGVSTQAKASLSRVSNQDMALFSAGTISYMAPERFSRNNLPIMANDIYSLGSTVYEMLSGFLPFGNDGGLLQKKGADIPELQGDFSPLLKHTLEQCLQEEPWQRPTAEQLEEIAANAIKNPASRNEAPEAPKQPEVPLAKATTMQIPKEYLDAAANASLQNNSLNEPASSKRMYIYIGVAVVALLLAIGGYMLFSGNGSTADSDENTEISADSLLRLQTRQEFEASMTLLNQNTPDSVQLGFSRLTALAQQGYPEAIKEVAFTYAWVPNDMQSIVRKQLLGWVIDELGRPTDIALNSDAVEWLGRSVSVSDSTDYKSLYWLSFYYLNGIAVKFDMPHASQLLQKAKTEAMKNRDYNFASKIDDTLKQLQ